MRFVSFTVDPARDTPPVLTAYAKHFEADPAKWYFLTGADADLNRMSRDVFMLGNVDGSLEHSTRFALDRRLRAHSRLLSDFGTGSDSHADRRRQALAEGADLIGLHDLPAINAVLNATAAVLLVTAFVLIKQGRREAHKRVMLAAFAVSSVFLVSYLIYHCASGVGALSAHRLDPHRLPDHSDHAHDPGRERAGARDHHAAARS